MDGVVTDFLLARCEARTSAAMMLPSLLLRLPSHQPLFSRVFPDTHRQPFKSPHEKQQQQYIAMVSPGGNE